MTCQKYNPISQSAELGDKGDLVETTTTPFSGKITSFVLFQCFVKEHGKKDNVGHWRKPVC